MLFLKHLHTQLLPSWFKLHSLLGLARTIFIYGAYTEFLAGKSPNIRSYTVHTYNSGQPYSFKTRRGIGGAPAEVAKTDAIARIEVLREELEAAKAEAAAAAAVVLALGLGGEKEGVRGRGGGRESEGANVEGDTAGSGEGGGVGDNVGDLGTAEGTQAEVDVNEKRTMLQLCNRVVYHCLGALGVFAVDQGARAAALQVHVCVCVHVCACVCMCVCACVCHTLAYIM